MRKPQRAGERRWRIVWERGRDPATGKRRQETETVRGTKHDAEARWWERQREIDQGIGVHHGGRHGRGGKRLIECRVG